MIKATFRYLRNSANLFSFSGNLLFAAFSFVTFLIMVRFMSKEAFGQWLIYSTMAGLLDMLRVGLTGTAAIRLLSVANASNRNFIIASSYHLNVITTVAIAILFYASYPIVLAYFPHSYYLPVLKYYPLLALANLSFSQAITVAQGTVNFKQIIIIRLINGGFIMMGIGVYLVNYSADIQDIIIIHIIANLLTSLYTTFRNLDGIRYIKLCDIALLKKITSFGKYSTASFVGSNLLRSSDTLILSMSAAMGPEAIAIYAIPFKFVEFAEVPLRSFTAAAFPKFSSALHTSKTLFNHTLSLYTLFTTLLLLPVAFILGFFPEFFLALFGGNQFADSLPLQVNITYFVLIYVLLLPIDRYSGVALFAIDKPEINFMKIMFMLVTNVVIDLFAVFVFESLILMVAGTVFFTIPGILIGWYYICQETGYNLSALKSGYREMLKIIKAGLKKTINV